MDTNTEHLSSESNSSSDNKKDVSRFHSDGIVAEMEVEVDDDIEMICSIDDQNESLTAKSVDVLNIPDISDTTKMFDSESVGKDHEEEIELDEKNVHVEGTKLKEEKLPEEEKEPEQEGEGSSLPHLDSPFEVSGEPKLDTDNVIDSEMHELSNLVDSSELDEKTCLASADKKIHKRSTDKVIETTDKFLETHHLKTEGEGEKMDENEDEGNKSNDDDKLSVGSLPEADQVLKNSSTQKKSRKRKFGELERLLMDIDKINAEESDSNDRKRRRSAVKEENNSKSSFYSRRSKGTVDSSDKKEDVEHTLDSKSKISTTDQGYGEMLGNIPTIRKHLQTCEEQIQHLYHVLFGELNPAKIHKAHEAILAFRGFPFGENSSEFSRRKRLLKNMPENTLKYIWRTLGLIKGTRTDIVSKIMTYLKRPYVTFLQSKDKSMQPVVRLERLSLGNSYLKKAIESSTKLKETNAPEKSTRKAKLVSPKLKSAKVLLEKVDEKEDVQPRRGKRLSSYKDNKTKEVETNSAKTNKKSQISKKPEMSRKPQVVEKSSASKAEVSKKPQVVEKSSASKAEVSKKPQVVEKSSASKPEVSKKPEVVEKSSASKPVMPRKKPGPKPKKWRKKTVSKKDAQKVPPSAMESDAPVESKKEESVKTEEAHFESAPTSSSSSTVTSSEVEELNNDLNDEKQTIDAAKKSMRRSRAFLKQLAKFPRISNSIRQADFNALQRLHILLFGASDKPENLKANILAFGGFPFLEGSSEWNQKEFLLSLLAKNTLKEYLRLLCINYDGDDQTVMTSKLMKFLKSPSESFLIPDVPEVETEVVSSELTHNVSPKGEEELKKQKKKPKRKEKKVQNRNPKPRKVLMTEQEVRRLEADIAREQRILKREQRLQELEAEKFKNMQVVTKPKASAAIAPSTQTSSNKPLKQAAVTDPEQLNALLATVYKRRALKAAGVHVSPPNKGKTKLGDLSHVKFLIVTANYNELDILHHLIFMKDVVKSKVRKNILDFSGFGFTEDSLQYKIRMEFLNRCGYSVSARLAFLLGLCPFDTKIPQQDLNELIMYFLMSPCHTEEIPIRQMPQAFVSDDVAELAMLSARSAASAKSLQTVSPAQKQGKGATPSSSSSTANSSDSTVTKQKAKKSLNAAKIPATIKLPPVRKIVLSPNSTSVGSILKGTTAGNSVTTTVTTNTANKTPPLVNVSSSSAAKPSMKLQPLVKSAVPLKKGALFTSTVSSSDNPPEELYIQQKTADGHQKTFKLVRVPTSAVVNQNVSQHIALPPQQILLPVVPPKPPQQISVPVVPPKTPQQISVPVVPPKTPQQISLPVVPPKTLQQITVPVSTKPPQQISVPVVTSKPLQQLSSAQPIVVTSRQASVPSSISLPPGIILFKNNQIPAIIGGQRIQTVPIVINSDANKKISTVVLPTVQTSVPAPTANKEEYVLPDVGSAKAPESTWNDDDVEILHPLEDSGPSDDDLFESIQEIIHNSNFEHITLRNVIEGVAAKYSNYDLTHRHSYMKECVKQIILGT